MALRFECRLCKKVTDQIERIVTDNLPPNVKVLQCTKCGAMGVCLMDDAPLLPLPQLPKGHLPVNMVTL